MRKYQIALSTLLLSLVAGLIFFTVSNDRQSQPAKAAQFLRLNIPAVVHGFEKTNQLPDGDLFLLSEPLQMAISEAPDEARVFPLSIESFGDAGEAIGALPGTAPQGMALSTPNSKMVAKTCAESIWDSNLMIAGTAGTIGDKVRVFLETTDGKEGPELALFTLAGNGVELTQLHPDLMLFVNNRYANGPSVEPGSFISYAVYAGQSGLRTDLLTFAWPMKGMSELQGCFRIGIEISRGGDFGTTTVVVTDIVVNRNRVAGDENNTGFGLLRRLRGGYPSGFPCKANCPFTPEPPIPNIPNPGGGGDGGECNTICYRSPQYFRLNINRLPHGTVLIGGVNFNRPVSTTDQRALGMALRGGFTPLQQLNQEFVAAQLNALLAGGDGSPKVYYAMEGSLSCYGLNFESITLSNGFELTTESKLKDLYQQARFCIFNGRADDQIALARIFDMLNGNNPLNVCNKQ